MKKISESNGFSKMNILNNISELPDKTISNYLKKRKSQRWFIETETYCLKNDLIKIFYMIKNLRVYFEYLEIDKIKIVFIAFFY